MEISTKTSEDAIENGFSIREGAATIAAGSTSWSTAIAVANRRLLFQSLAHQWNCGSGTISLPPMEDMLFMPHTPYVPGGTLRESDQLPRGIAMPTTMLP